MLAKDFDKRAAEFGNAMEAASHWKDFFGAAYSTRIHQAIALAERAIADAKQLLIDDDDPYEQS